jgi:hypothetical protein
MGVKDNSRRSCLGFRRSAGRWSTFAGPKVTSATQGCPVTALAAGSAGAIWAGGVRGDQSAALPTIWRRTASGFIPEVLPKSVLAGDYFSIDSMSASSARNAWAVGNIQDAYGKPLALHWNGRAWSAVSLPAGRRPIGISYSSVSTSGPNNAWALESNDGEPVQIVHWDGSSWSASRRVPAGMYIEAIATPSSTLAYAVGSIPVSEGHRNSAALEYNGQHWTRMRFGDGAGHVDLSAVATHGRAAWAIGTSDSYRATVLHFTRGEWKVMLALPAHNYGLGSIAVVASTNVVASGSRYGTARAGTLLRPAYTFVTKYDGHAWTTQAFN